MTTFAKPAMRPARPEFSSGPCAKRPGWNLDQLQAAVLGRSHRSKIGKARLKDAIDRTRDVLEVPAAWPVWRRSSSVLSPILTDESRPVGGAWPGAEKLRIGGQCKRKSVAERAEGRDFGRQRRIGQA